MRKLAAAAFCFTVVFAVGCGSGSSSPKAASAPPKPKDLIVGKWEVVEPKEAKDMAIVMEFKGDGTILMSMNMLGAPLNSNGKYTFTADDMIQMDLEPPAEFKEKGAKTDSKKAKVEVTKDDLTLTPQDSKKPEVMKLKKKT